jgi:transposase
LLDDFFQCVHEAQATVAGRNLATCALGYAIHQERELRRVLEDPRLPLDNTRAERSLRKVVVGRQAWMFYGSDTHAESAAALFTLIASCRLHRIDPDRYLDEVLRLLPYWPKGRYLELAPNSGTGRAPNSTTKSSRLRSGPSQSLPPELQALLFDWG